MSTPINPKRGSENGAARLKEQDIPLIRYLYERFSMKKIARLIDVNESTVRDVVQGRTWRHVK